LGSLDSTVRYDVFVLGASVPSQDSEMSCICVLEISSQDLDSLTHKYMTSHCPDLALIPLTHKYMTSHGPDLVQIPHNTQIHDISLS
jgi:hypothetical protein